MELQLNPKFVIRYGINDTSDFRRLVKIVPGHHILFAELNEDKARQHLRNAGRGQNEIGRIMEKVMDCEGDLHAQCSVLRKRGKLKNVRRLLIPLRTNELVVKALKKWAKQWPTIPRKRSERG